MRGKYITTKLRLAVAGKGKKAGDTTAQTETVKELPGYAIKKQWHTAVQPIKVKKYNEESMAVLA